MALTDKDLRAITNLIKAETLGLATSVEVSKLAEKIDSLPTKDEIISLMDQITREHQTIRQEMHMFSNRAHEHEDRISSLEQIHPGGDHAH